MIIPFKKLNGQGITPLLLSTTENHLSDVLNSLLGNHFHWLITNRSYLTGEVILYRINQIYLLYINYRKQLIGNADAYLLLFLDG